MTPDSLLNNLEIELINCYEDDTNIRLNLMCGDRPYILGCGHHTVHLMSLVNSKYITIFLGDHKTLKIYENRDSSTFVKVAEFVSQQLTGPKKAILQKMVRSLGIVT